MPVMTPFPDPGIAAQFGHYLLPDEHVLWTGRPPTRIMFQLIDIFLVPFSFAWGGIAIGGIFAGAVNGERLPFPFLLIPLLFVFIGLYITVGRFLVDMWVRSRTVYAVSDRRVLVLRRIVSTTLQARDIQWLDTLELNERRSGKGTISFESVPYWFRGHEAFAPGLIGMRFVNIPDARAVYDLISRQGRRG